MNILTDQELSPSFDCSQSTQVWYTSDSQKHLKTQLKNVAGNAPDNFSSTLGHYPLFLTAVGIKVGDVSNRG